MEDFSGKDLERRSFFVLLVLRYYYLNAMAGATGLSF
jgi:hypothetical protein